MFGLVYSSWMASITTYTSIYDFVWPLAFAIIWKTKLSSNNVVIPFWAYCYVCSTPCSPTSTNSLYMPISLIMTIVSNYLCLLFKYFRCPPPLNFYGFSWCVSLIALL